MVMYGFVNIMYSGACSCVHEPLKIVSLSSDNQL